MLGVFRLRCKSLGANAIIMLGRWGVGKHYIRPTSIDISLPILKYSLFYYKYNTLVYNNPTAIFWQTSTKYYVHLAVLKFTDRYNNPLGRCLVSTFWPLVVISPRWLRCVHLNLEYGRNMEVRCENGTRWEFDSQLINGIAAPPSRFGNARNMECRMQAALSRNGRQIIKGNRGALTSL